MYRDQWVINVNLITYLERPENQPSWSDEVLERVTSGTDDEKPRRPDSLNFAADRKPHFQFSLEGSSKREESKL